MANDKAYKPENYNDLSPYLIVDDPHGLIRFMEAALDGKTKYIVEHEGRVVHAEVQLGDSIIMLSGSNEQFPAVKTVLHLYVPDVDTLFQRCLEAGGVQFHPPQQNPGESDRRGTFTDPFGNMWSLGTKVS